MSPALTRRLRARAARQRDYWAHWLQHYADAYGQTPLHVALGVTEESLDRLSLWPMPRRNHVDRDLTVIASVTGVPKALLSKLLDIADEGLGFGPACRSPAAHYQGLSP